MKNKLKIILPNKKLFFSFLNMKKEMGKEKKKFPGHDYLVKQPADFLGYRKKKFNERNGIDLPRGIVPSTTYWGVVNNKVVGNLNLRHFLNKNLREVGGHIGYGVHPKERGRGYATEMLRLGLKKAWAMGMNKALITCDVANIASRKVIEKNGGLLENQKGDKLRFWIYK